MQVDHAHLVIGVDLDLLDEHGEHLTIREVDVRPRRQLIKPGELLHRPGLQVGLSNRGRRRLLGGLQPDLQHVALGDQVGQRGSQFVQSLERWVGQHRHGRLDLAVQEVECALSPHAMKSWPVSFLAIVHVVAAFVMAC